MKRNAYAKSKKRFIIKATAHAASAALLGAMGIGIVGWLRQKK